MTDKEKKKAIKDFYSLLNSIRYNIYAKKCKTVADSFKLLGRDSPPGQDPNTAITGKLFNELIKPLEEYVLQNGTLPEIRKESRQSVLVEVPEKDTKEDWEKEILPFIPPKNKKQTCTLYPFQLKAAHRIWYLLHGHHSGGALLRANTGDGKAFVIGQILRWLNDIDYAKGKTFSPFKYLVITKASIVEQTIRVFEEEFGLEYLKDFWCVNYDAMRSSFGFDTMIEKKTVIEFGEAHEVFEWKPFLYPIFVALDEVHSVKNLGSKQSKTFQALCDIKDPNLFILSSSATPFSKVSSAKVFCVSTRHKYDFLGSKNIILTNDNWNNFSKRLASPAEPNEFSKAAIKRLIKEFKPYIVTFKNVYRKFKSKNNTMIIPFETKEKSERYESAWERFQKRKCELEGRKNEYMLTLAAFTVFRHESELLRADTLARLGKEYTDKGYSVIYATCYKDTIAKATDYLVKDYNVTRDQISLIWGGDSKYTNGGNGDEAYSREQIQELLAKAMSGEEIDGRKLKKIINQLHAEAAGLDDLDPNLDLGIQTREKRQYEIDKFQSGKSHYCFFTFQAGGAGLSLHHYRSFLRQRRTFLTPTYNEMEMEQGFGRAHRINSLSDTEQSIILYAGTIEERVLSRMCQKKTCLDVMTQFGLEPDREAEKVISVMQSDEDEMLNEREFEEMEED